MSTHDIGVLLLTTPPADDRTPSRSRGQLGTGSRGEGNGDGIPILRAGYDEGPRLKVKVLAPHLEQGAHPEARVEGHRHERGHLPPLTVVDSRGGNQACQFLRA
jgi:hypothetical protein